MVLLNKGKGSKGGRRLASSAALRGERGAQTLTIRYEPFEQQMLTWLGGLDEAAFVADPDVASLQKELGAVEGMRADVMDRIGKVESRLVEGSSGKFDSMLDLLEQLAAKARELEARREELKAKLHDGQRNVFRTYRTAWQRLREAPLDKREGLRTRLKTAIAAMVDRFEVTMEQNGLVRHVLVKVHAKGRGGPWYVYFVVRGLRSAWLSIGGRADADLETLREARYVPFSWKNIPKADETDMAIPAPAVKGVLSDTGAVS